MISAMNKAVKFLMLVAGIFVFASSTLRATAENTPGMEPVATEVAKEMNKESQESLFPKSSRDLRTSHFTWGAELGSSIDLSSHDMSTMDLDVLLGYKNKVIRTAGIGMGVHRALGNGSTFIPIYAILRTSFTPNPAPCFLHLKVGYSFNSVADSPTLGDISASIGLGINLAMTRRCMTHIIIAYGFRHFSYRHSEIINIGTQDISLAQLSFGINF